MTKAQKRHLLGQPLAAEDIEKLAQLHSKVCEHTIHREDVIRCIDKRSKSPPPNKWTFLVLEKLRCIAPRSRFLGALAARTSLSARLSAALQS
jgi:hypothetical protein